MTNLILCGFKGCGKSHFGLRLAQKSLRPFIDTDESIERLYTEKTGEKKEFREIYRDSGAPFFRLLEKQAILALEEATDSIVALGGGALLDPDNIKILKQFGTLVYLKAEKNVIQQRLLDGPRPAFLEEYSFEKMFEEREPIYAKNACVTLDLREKEESQIVTDLMEILGGK